MLRVFTAVLIDETLVLYQFVLLAEADVSVSVKLCDMLGKVFDGNRTLGLIADRTRCLQVHIGQRMRLIWIVEIVVVALNASSRRFKWLD